LTNCKGCTEKRFWKRQGILSVISGLKTKERGKLQRTKSGWRDLGDAVEGEGRKNSLRVLGPKEFLKKKSKRLKGETTKGSPRIHRMARKNAN